MIMHELWLCRGILDIIREKTVNKLIRVKKITLEIGQLAAVEKEALLFSFSVASKGTVAEDAALQIIEIPAQARCESCKNIVFLQQYYDDCSICGGHSLTVIQGEELRVQSMVVE